MCTYLAIFEVQAAGVINIEDDIAYGTLSPDDSLLFPFYDSRSRLAVSHQGDEEDCDPGPAGEGEHLVVEVVDAASDVSNLALPLSLTLAGCYTSAMWEEEGRGT